MFQKNMSLHFCIFSLFRWRALYMLAAKQAEHEDSTSLAGAAFALEGGANDMRMLWHLLLNGELINYSL